MLKALLNTLCRAGKELVVVVIAVALGVLSAASFPNKRVAQLGCLFSLRLQKDQN